MSRPTCTFYHKHLAEEGRSPQPKATGYLVALHVEADGAVLFDDQEGDVHPVAAGEGDTHAERARPGVLALICEVAAAKGLTLRPDDVIELHPPAGA